MNGAEGLLAAAGRAGVEVCFANPGTTELPLVAAFDSVGGIRTALCLAEGVVTGAADGYARMSGRPAMTLLHLGPGLANGIANLHNARRARTPVVNVVGEHATWHQAADAPLASDIESLARPVSGWVGRTTSAATTGADFLVAHQAALRERMPATLVVAADHQWERAAGAPGPLPDPRPAGVDDERIEGTARLLSGAARPALLLGGDALGAAGLRDAARVAAAVGGEVFAEGSPARIERGPDVPVARSLPYFPEDVSAVLAEFTHLVLVGTGVPVSFFGYPGGSSVPVPGHVQVHPLATAEEDALGALAALAEAVGAAAGPPARERPEPVRPEGALTAESLAAAVALAQPEGAIVVNEGITSSAAYPELAAAAPAHTELGLTGGAIGMGIPVATGAALACPDRPVIGLQADGSAAYSPQGLWTQAREGLNVTTVLCANSRYRILEAELHRAGVREPGRSATGMTDLGAPGVDWVALATGFGVPATRASTAGELVAALHRARTTPGPHLVEATLT
ncbi:acetolactate synthase large subunit [Saccharopolyspora sp. MS10]|uniref:acetolactate synthase large subunit n=1 Tax=Saccharopolyspora sp. MS10 TaxID=3385973 RepID=UPI0039A19ED6